jgi:ABC-2 type transport system ATP-binding protein
MITITNLTKYYQKKQVLDIDTLHLDQGEIIGLVGNNGAGKTTLFRCILDLIQPDSGQVTILGNDVSKTEDWKKVIGSYLDEDFLIPYLYPMEYLSFVCNAYGIDKNKITELVEPFKGFVTDDFLYSKKIIQMLSMGNKHKVGITAAMMIKPQVLILDEPFANLDPSSQIRLKNLILQRKIELPNSMSIVSSHDLDFVYEISDRILILERGKIVQNRIKSESSFEDLKAYFEQI